MCTCKQQQVKIKFYMRQWRSQSTKKNYCYIVHPKCGSHEDFFMTQIPYDAVYFNATESITWTNEDLNQQRRIIVILYIPNVEVMKSFYKSNNWWCTLLEGNRKKILQWNNYKIMKKQGKNHTWRTTTFNGTTFRILFQYAPHYGIIMRTS